MAKKKKPLKPQKPKIYLGVDPGTGGATAIMYPDGKVVAYPWRDKADFYEVIADVRATADAEDWDVVAALEKVGGYIGRPQSGSMMFKFGANYGFIEGVLLACRIPLELVPPQRWQKELHCGKGKDYADHKRVLKEHAKRLYPKEKVTLANADALLILEWARRFCPL